MLEWSCVTYLQITQMLQWLFFWLPRLHERLTDQNVYLFGDKNWRIIRFDVLHCHLTLRFLIQKGHTKTVCYPLKILSLRTMWFCQSQVLRKYFLLFKEITALSTASHRKPSQYLLLDVSRVQGVVQGCFGSLVWLPGLDQIHCDPHVDTDHLDMVHDTTQTQV